MFNVLFNGTSAPSFAFSVMENATVGTAVGAALPASDPEDAQGAGLLFSITAGNAGGVFSIDVVTGRLSVVGSMVYEVQSTYTLTVSLKDTGAPDGASAVLSTTTSVIISVIHVNKRPYFTNLPCTLTVPENAAPTTSTGTATAQDPDTGDVVTFALVSADAVINKRAAAGTTYSGASVTVGSATGVVLTAASFDYETVTGFTVGLRVTDAGGLSGTVSCALAVTDVNEAPTFPQSTVTLSVGAATALGRVLGYAGAADPDYNDTLSYSIDTAATYASARAEFAVDAATGAVTTLVDHTSTFLTIGTRYFVIVIARDRAGLTATLNVTLQVSASSGPPTMNPTTVSVPENSAVGSNAGAAIAAVSANGFAVAYSIVGGNVNGAFAIGSSTGQLTVASSAALDFETRPSFALVVQATAGGESSTATVTVTVTDVNERPTITAAPVATVDENVAAGAVVFTAGASDPDASDGAAGVLVYSLVTTGVPFAVHPTTGAVRVASATVDYEARASYTLQVRVTDSGWDGKGALTADASVVVTVNNRNDAPTLADAAGAVSENAAGALAATVSGQDQDASQALVYSLSRTDMACWSTAVTGATAGTRVSDPFVMPDVTTGTVSVYARVQGLGSTGVATVVLAADATGASDRYEVRMTATGTSVYRCAATCPAAALASTGTSFIAVTSPSTASPLSNVRIDLDFSNLQVRVYAFASGDYGATGSATASWTAAEPAASLVAVRRVGVVSSVPGTRFTSVCFTSPTYAAGARFAIDSTSGAISTAAGVDYEAQQQYGMEVKVTDQPGAANLQPASLSEYAVVLVSVTDVNEAPAWSGLVSCPGFAATYASCLTLLENSTQGFQVLPAVTAAVDPDTVGVPQTLTYALAQTNNVANGGAIYSIGASTRVVSLSQAVLDYETTKTYELTVTVRDSGSPSQSATALVAVTVADVNEAPVVRDAARSVQEQTVFNNAPPGTLVGAPLTATDPDTAGSAWATLSWSVVGGDGAALFSIASATGQVSLTSATNASSLDFETKNTYSLRVRVTDGGGLSSDATVTISLADVNEPPALRAPFTRSVSENLVGPQSVGSAVGVADPDIGQTLSFTLTGGNGTTVFRIDSCSGQLSLIAGVSVDYETARAYVVEVTVTDSGSPALTDRRNVTISVLDADDAPVVANQGVSVAENSGAGTVVGAPLVASDADVFGGYVPWFTQTWSIVGGNAQGVFAVNATTGQLYVASGGPALLNYEDPRQSSFALLVRATDGGGLSAQATVTVTVTDVNEAPAFAEAAPVRSIDENCPRSPRAAGNAVGAAVAATDPDAGQTAQLAFAITGGNAAGYFAIGAGGQVTLTASGAAGLDYETTRAYNLSLSATDPSGLSASTYVVVNVVNRNEAPVFNVLFNGTSAPSFARSVLENATIGLAVGAALQASDPEDRVGAGLAFSITGGNVAGVFGVDGTGLVYVANPATLVFESVQSYSLTVTVSDSGAPDGVLLSMTTTVFVTVLPVNHAPRLLPASFFIAENSGVGSPVGGMAASASDPDTRTPAFGLGTYAIVSQDVTVASVTGPGGEAPFAINAATGAITVAANSSGGQPNLDFEAKASYALTVRVTDLAGLSATATVTLTVVNVNEAPVWLPVPSLYARALDLQDVGQALLAYVRDQDATVAATGESLSFAFGSPSGNTNSIFALSSQSGQLSVVNNASLVCPGCSAVVTGPVFSLRITVQDAGIAGARLSSTTVVTVTTVDNNFAPTIPATYSFTVVENTPLGVEVARVFASDRDSASGQFVTYTLVPAGANVNRPFPFNITTAPNTGVGNVGAGIIAVAWDGVAGSVPWGYLDNEAPAKQAALGGVGFRTYTMSVTATDSHFSHLTATSAVTIFVLDAPEAPYFAPSRVPGAGYFTLTVPENSGVGATLTLVPSQSVNGGGVGGSVLGYDDDASDAGALSYALVGGNSTLFAINAATGALTVSAAGAAAGALNFESSLSVLTLTVRVMDLTGRTDTALVTVALTDTNEAPTWVGTGVVTAAGAQATSLSVAEGVAVGTFVGRVAAADVDAGAAGQLVYALLANSEAAPFDIDASTGKITVLAPALLDWEDKPAWTPTVVVKDASAAPLSIRQVVTVTLVDVNDLTVTGFAIVSGEAAAGRGVDVATSPFVTSHATMATLFATAGGATVAIAGTNMGFSSRRIVASGLTQSPTAVSVTYGPMGTEYTAAGCVITVPSAEVMCRSAPGFGVDHTWRVTMVTTVAAANTTAVFDTASAPAVKRTGYLPPRVTAVVVQGAAAGDASANAMSTGGGAVLTVTGGNFGPLATAATLLYGPAGSESAYAAACTVTVARRARRAQASAHLCTSGCR